MQFWTRFRNRKPAKHVALFLVLHEVTGVASIAAVYVGIVAFRGKATKTENNLVQNEESEEKQILPIDGHQSQKIIERLADRFGFKPSAQTVIDLAASYIIVKAMMPIRIMLCLWLTPHAAKIFKSPRFELFASKASAYLKSK